MEKAEADWFFSSCDIVLELQLGQNKAKQQTRQDQVLSEGEKKLSSQKEVESSYFQMTQLQATKLRNLQS